MKQKKFMKKLIRLLKKYERTNDTIVGCLLDFPGWYEFNGHKFNDMGRIRIQKLDEFRTSRS